jgi:hypothetical protein
LLLVGLTGRKFSGKDTAAAGLIEHNGFTQVSFAKPLKDMTAAYLRYLGHDEETIQRYLLGDLKEVPDPAFAGKSCRYFQQMLGTEFARNMISQTFWIDAFMMKAALYDKVVCTDVRFQNEVDLIRNCGGYLVRIKSAVDSYTDAASQHSSETAIDSFVVDHEILNYKNGKENLQNSLIDWLNSTIPFDIPTLRKVN